MHQVMVQNIFVVGALLMVADWLELLLRLDLGRMPVRLF